MRTVAQVRGSVVTKITISPESLECVWSGGPPPFDLAATSALCQVPGVRLLAAPDHLSGKLEIPRNAERLVAARSIVESLTESSPRVTAVGQPHYVDTDTFTRKPYDYQKAAADCAVARGCQLLCDEMGLGKTTTASMAAETVRRTMPTRPVVICGLKILGTVWQRELIALGVLRDEHDPAFLRLEGMHGDIKRLLVGRPHEQIKYVFVHFEIVAAWWSLLSLWRPCVVILDEAHTAKNPKSQRGKAARMITTSAPLRLVLTGTPVLNRLGELHALLWLTTGPWSFGSLTDFRIRYAGAVREGYGVIDGEPSNVDELNTRLEGVYVRRTKADVGLALPPLTRQMVEVDLDEKASDAYRAKLGGYAPRDVVRALLTKGGSSKTLQWTGDLRKAASRGKFQATVEFVASLLEQGQDAICFTWERAMAERIADAPAVRRVLDERRSGHSYFIHGEIDRVVRDETIDRFQQHGGLLVATFGALSTGVTLHRASAVVMHDLVEVPGHMLQAEARAWRIGQRRATTSYWMTARGTVDAIIAKIFERKGAAIAALGDTSAASLGDLLAEDEIETLFGSAEEVLAWAQKGTKR